MHKFDLTLLKVYTMKNHNGSTVSEGKFEIPINKYFFNSLQGFFINQNILRSIDLIFFCQEQLRA